MSFKWEEGRQGSGYQKLKLFESKRFKCDCYLLWMDDGIRIPFHTDPVEGFKHYRANLVIKEPLYGGVLMAHVPIFMSRRLNIFRSDFPHAVSTVHCGERLVLSLGWLRKVIK